jgi:hypothetical protein
MRRSSQGAKGGVPADIPPLPVPATAPPRTFWGRWLFSGGPLDELQDHPKSSRPWYLVIWLSGVDYFSTLAYQPGIALIAAGLLSPPATLILVLVTILGAFPVYAMVARRSYAGQGSLAMLENLLSGWSSKIFVLVLLGFAATDFVITMTLSAADAARHATANPLLHPYLGTSNKSLTIALLTVLAFIFLLGFKEAIQVATAVAIPFLALNFVVLGDGLIKIVQHPALISGWHLSLTAHGDWTGVIIASAIIFPKLALGLSGFETGVAVMPLISEEPAKNRSSGKAQSRGVPWGRIRATRKLLAAAVAIMGFFLILSSFVTTLLIPADAYRAGGPASGRCIAYLAHQMFGDAFGTLFDFSTILILWFAGASAMAGLINLIPRYLPRFGMAPRWVSYRRPMVLGLFFVDVVVTLAFHAGVEAQGAAYATGVLALILSAAIAVAIALGREYRAEPGRPAASLALCTYFWGVAVLFTYILIDNAIERPEGVVISSVFIVGILMFSAFSRYQRARELRVSQIAFADADSAELWKRLVGKKVNLVPSGAANAESRLRKASGIRRHYSLSAPLAFIHVRLLDNRSEFVSPLRLQVTSEKENYLIEVSGAIAIANTIAYISELIDPLGIFLNLTRHNLMVQSFRYLLWGEGEVGLMVYQILLRYWEWTPPGDVRPLIFLMSG